MAGINKVILVGNLGKDSEVMTYDNGTKRATFSLATTESYRDKENNWQEQTEWHNIVLWRYLAEKNLIKGDKIYLEGRIRNRSYEDKDGVTKYITEIQGDKILKLSSAGGGGYQNAPAPEAPAVEEQKQTNTPSSTEKEDDLPF
ncbi:MAG: single-stranded DNA-binding protein [Bacteroidetes bacterium 4572_77]|nr:MAG: single-stranded DNA-binding protein [Bacteroidetes bacterium 4572_77]